MKLRDGGLDIFYIDETEKNPLSVVTSVRVPFLRRVEGEWTFVWADYLAKAIEWRRAISAETGIKYHKELHANELLAHRGLYKKPNNNLRPDEALAVCTMALSTISFLEPASIMTAYATDQTAFMGERRIKAALLGLFQRIRRQCGQERNGLVIFDDGRPEYVTLYRRATRWLPTGSALGGWPGSSLNLAMDMFPKDANVKSSKQSLFLQIADLVVTAARLKLEYEREILQAKRIGWLHHTIYDALPPETINLAATGKRADGIVPMLMH
jgi:hypothetical protein